MEMGRGVNALFDNKNVNTTKLIKELFEDFKKYVEDYYPRYEGDESYYNEVGLEKVAAWEEKLKDL